MHIFISLWSRNLTGSKLTSPFGFFRHLQQEEILTKALLYRRMFSPKVKDDSQYEEALHTPSGRRWQGWARGLPSVEPHAALKHATSTPRPPVCRAGAAAAGPGGSVLCCHSPGVRSLRGNSHSALDTRPGPVVRVSWGCQSTSVPPFTWLWKVFFLHLFSIWFSILQSNPDSKSSG